MADSNAPFALRWWAVTDKGRFRKNNEDAFLCLLLDGQEVFRLGRIGESPFEKGDYVFAVADGMGGANAGEFASQIAVDKITQLLPRSFRMQASGLRRGGEDFIAEVFSRIHQEMTRMGQAYEETSGMGSTLSLCWFAPEKVYFGHVGDSRIYHLPQGGKYFQITHDHTHTGYLVRNGKITESQARAQSNKTGLQMALGGKIQVLEPQIGTVLYEPGDWFIFTTDGVSDAVSSPKLEDLVRRPNARNGKLNPVDRLLDEARMTARDNMTAIVVEVLGSHQLDCYFSNTP